MISNQMKRDYIIVPGYDNVISLKQVKTFKECEKLFTGWKNRLSNMNPNEIALEKDRLLKECAGFPNHLLTKVKIHIFENATNQRI